jgi:outer membrane protein OmpA-like peptidoglycan-associated protein
MPTGNSILKIKLDSHDGIIPNHQSGGTLMEEIMIKQMLIACLLVFGLAVGGSGAADFDVKYDTDPECFMSFDYINHNGPAPQVWVVTSTDSVYKRKYLRLDGKVWRDRNQTVEEALPCCAGRTIAPVWLCPEPEPVAVVAPVTMAVGPKVFVVYFDFDKDLITDEAEATLLDALQYAQENGYESIALVASCDFRGSDAYNIELGERRATAVEHWLIENGISPAVFEVENNGDRLSPDRIMKGRYCADCWEDRKVEVTIE